MNKLACPKCKEKLVLNGSSYICSNRHTYDLSRSRYLNLLLNPDKATTFPGDSKESLIARKAYLNQGYYNLISDACIQLIKKYSANNLQILDLGCGEGYYLKRLKEYLGSKNTYYGLDISKDAIQMATGYDKDIYWLVANSKNIPIIDSSLDVILALFTVVNEKELDRVLNDDGYIIHVTANPYHLVEIKELIYDEIKVKSDEHIRLGFNVVESFDITQRVSINTSEDVINLLKMTPHYYHIKKEKRDIIDTLTSMTITIDVKLTIYKK